MRWAPIAAVAMLCSGCSLVNVPVALPQGPLDPSAYGGERRRIAVWTPFREGRNEPERCGMLKNALSLETAGARCIGDPNAWLADRLIAELRAADFEVLSPDAELAPDVLRIEGTLLQLFVEPLVPSGFLVFSPVLVFATTGIEADLSARIVATSASGLRAERTFYVKGWHDKAVGQRKGAYDAALERAAQGLIAELVEAIIELADRYPTLGGLDFNRRHLAAHAGTGDLR